MLGCPQLYGMVTHSNDIFNTPGSYLQLLPEDVKNQIACCITHEQYLNEKIIAQLGIQIFCNKYEVINKLPEEFIPRSKLFDPTFYSHCMNGKEYLNFVFDKMDNFKNIELPKHHNRKLSKVELSPNNQLATIFMSYTDRTSGDRYSIHIFDATRKKLLSFKDTVDAVISNDTVRVMTAAHQHYSNVFFCIRNVQTGSNIASLKLPPKYPPFDAVELFFDKSGQNVGLVATTVTRMQIFFRWNLGELFDKEQKLKLLTAREQALLLSYLVKIKKDPTAISDAEIDTFVKPLDAKIKEGSSLISKAIKDMSANMGRLLNQEENQMSNFTASDTETSP